MGQPRTRKVGQGVVKAVPGGDIIIVMGGCEPGQFPPEMQIILSGISAPRTGRGRNGNDEPFAFESREFLRKKCIGQPVRFSINHTSESGTSFGDVFLLRTNENLAEYMVRSGWALSKDADKDAERIFDDRRVLVDYHNSAKDMQLGLHEADPNPARHTRHVSRLGDDESQVLFQKMQGRELNGVVDYVRDGSTFRIELLGQHLQNTMILLHLAGVQAPRIPQSYSYLKGQYDRKKAADPSYGGRAPNKEDCEPEPFATEAQHWSAARLLHRDVRIVLRGIDKFSNFFGSILYAKGNISEKLLSLGLASLVPWSAELTPEADILKKASALAKASRVRLMANYIPSAVDETRGTTIVAKCIEVKSGDSMIIRDDDGKDHRIFFASVIAPRLGRRDRGHVVGRQPWAPEALESVRRQCIGKQVRVLWEYNRTPSADAKNQTPRRHATVFFNRGNVAKNLSLMLLEEGLVEVARHRPDEDRSQFSAQYMKAETIARQAKKGIHGPNPPVDKTIDLTICYEVEEEEQWDNDGNKKRPRKGNPAARGYVDTLKRLTRGGKLSGTVEYVINPTRIKVKVHRENIMIMLKLGGITTPREDEEDGKRNKFDQAALDFLRGELTQHTVKIEVEGMDKGDNFIGSIYTPDRKHASVLLLQKGLAQVMPFSASLSMHEEDLLSAQAVAKEEKIGLWENYVEPDPEEVNIEDNVEDENFSLRNAEGQTITVRVTDIQDAKHFYVQHMTEQNKETLSTITVAMEAFAADTPVAEEGWWPEKGWTYAAKFSDGAWYRVRCDGFSPDNGVKVYYKDYGNFDICDLKDILPLAEEVAELPGLAKACVLAGVQGPTRASEYHKISADKLNEYAFGQDLLAKVELVDRGSKMHLTLIEDDALEEEQVSINCRMVREGWCRVEEKPDRQLFKLCERLKSEEEGAKKNHLNIWEYGDVSDDEGEENERFDGGRPPKRQ